MSSAGVQASATTPLSPPHSAVHEVLTLVSRQVGLMPWPVFLSAALIMSIAMRNHPHWLMFGWLLMVVVGVLILHAHLVQRFAQHREPVRPGAR